MKRFLALFLVCTMLFVLVACRKEIPEELTDLISQNANLGKIEEELDSANCFSEGLASVSTKSGGKYFINKNGEIVIDFTSYTPSSGYRKMFTSFVNGLAIIDTMGTAIDKKGKITRPEDVGVTRFYGAALEGGYLLAEIEESNYAQTTNKLGVMDTEFNWLIQPTEQNYKLLCYDDKFIDLDIDVEYYKGYFYIGKLNKFLNLKDFTLHSEWKYDSEPETWHPWGDDVYRSINADSDSKPKLDLSKKTNIESLSCFVNGKAAVTFCNEESKKSYFTIIDSKGNFSFEPIKIFDDWNVSLRAFDGETIVLSKGGLFKAYDSEGNLLGELKADSFFNTCELGDGVVLINKTYYNPNLTPLF